MSSVFPFRASQRPYSASRLVPQAPGTCAPHTLTRTHAHSSDASPLYLILFLTATYLLHRPCVYCSFLLAVLVLSLFDFSGDWLADRHVSSLTPSPSPTSSPLAQSVVDVVLAAATSALGAVAVGGGRPAEEAPAVGLLAAEWTRPAAAAAWSRWGLEWARGIAERRELRIACIDAVVRL